jgi:hypothetical protein
MPYLSESSPTRLQSRAGSLISSATVVDGVERLWDTVEWLPDLCVSGGSFEPCDPPTKTITPQDGPQTSPVHGLWEGATCSTGASMDQINLTAERARNAFSISLSHKVEAALWTGGTYAPITDNTALASTAADDLTLTGPVGVTTALSLVIAELDVLLGGGRGMIHVAQSVVPYLNAYYQLVRNGNIIQVANTDHVVVTGTGYPGTSPDGVAPVEGETWIYGTGPVQVLLSPEFVPQPHIDRSVNQLEVRAERAAAILFAPCAHVAANVCLPDPGPDCAAS